MKTKRFLWCLALLCCVSAVRAAEDAPAFDLRKIAPPEAHMVVYGKHNPERDYQKVYWQEIFQTVRDEKLVERIVEIATSRMTQEQLDKSQAVLAELRAATASLDSEVLNNCAEIVYFQQIQMPTNQHLVAMRFNSDGAEKLEASVKNLFQLVEKYSEGKVPSQTYNIGTVEVTTLGIPQGIPFRPIVARQNDILLISSSDALMHTSLTRLQGDGGPSKFDDPRLVEALSKLPEPEDSIVFFDSTQMFRELGHLGEFIRKQVGDNPEAQAKVERVVGLIDVLMNEMSVLDFEATVEYTEGNQNRRAVFGKALPGAENKLLGMLLSGGESFDDWQKWIPADAVSYSLSSGVRLHPFYERLTQLLAEKIPESKPGLDKWEAVQEQVGVHLDRDILQSFSGEFVSVTLPTTNANGEHGHESMIAMKCENPQRIHELLQRLVVTLNQIPAVQAQQLKLEKCEELPEFERINAMTFAMFNWQPVIGFHDGWMIFGSSQSAVQRVLDTQAGKAPNIESSESFRRFDAGIEGPVRALSYADLAEHKHHAAQGLRKIGMIAPMILGMAGAQAKPEDLKPFQEVLALLPSLANVLEKFDFLEARLSVVQPGDEPYTYTKQSVTLVRPPAEQAAAN